MRELGVDPDAVNEGDEEEEETVDVNVASTSKSLKNLKEEATVAKGETAGVEAVELERDEDYQNAEELILEKEQVVEQQQNVGSSSQSMDEARVKVCPSLLYSTISYV